MTDAPTPPPAADAKRERAAQAREFLDRLAARYPAAFTRDREQVRPLAIGTQQKLRAELAEDPEWKDTPGWLVRQALAIYTRSPAYLTAIVEGRPRIQLDGSVAGEVTEQEKAHARARLDEIAARRAARRPSRGKGRRRGGEQRQQPDTEERTRRKLEQLAEKFSRR
jgi:ProP effector